MNNISTQQNNTSPDNNTWSATSFVVNNISWVFTKLQEKAIEVFKSTLPTETRSQIQNSEPLNFEVNPIIPQKALNEFEGVQKSAAEYNFDKINAYIQKNIESWSKLAIESNIYILSNENLSRSIQLDSDGSLFIHFNRSIKYGNDKLIGLGSVKKVKLALEITANKYFASSSMLRVHGEKELEKMKLIKDIEGIIQLRSYVHYQNKNGIKKTRIITPYLPGKLLDSNRTLESNLLIAKELLKALSNLHSKKIIHRDIKCSNICLDENNKPYIIDPGIICKEDDIEQKKSRSGTRLYFSPETFIDYLNISGDFSKSSTSKRDVWAMGMVLYELFLNRRVPWWNGITQRDLEKIRPRLIRQILSDINKFAIKLPVRPFDSIWVKSLPILEIIWDMFKIDPTQRITSEEALKRFENLRCSQDGNVEKS